MCCSSVVRVLGALNVVISDEIDRKFREEVGKRFGAERGNLARATEEALELWIRTKVK